MVVPSAVPGGMPPSSLDLIGLSCLMGNDYLPKIREATFERLWKSFVVLRQLPDFSSAALMIPIAGDGDGGAAAGGAAAAARDGVGGAALTFNYAYLAAILILTQRTSSLATAEMTRLVEQEGWEQSKAVSRSLRR